MQFILNFDLNLNSSCLHYSHYLKIYQIFCKSFHSSCDSTITYQQTYCFQSEDVMGPHLVVLAKIFNTTSSIKMKTLSQTLVVGIWI